MDLQLAQQAGIRISGLQAAGQPGQAHQPSHSSSCTADSRGWGCGAGCGVYGLSFGCAVTLPLPVTYLRAVCCACVCVIGVECSDYFSSDVAVCSVLV